MSYQETGSPLPPAPPASFGGKGCGRYALIVCGVVLALAILGFIAASFWYRRNSGEIEAGGKLGARDGARFGLVRDEAACFDEGRRRAAGTTKITEGFAVGAFVRSCLEYSRETPGYCEGVPPITSIRRSATWQVEKCANDANCRNVAQVVQSYCAQGRPKRPAADTLLMNASDSAGGGVPPIRSPASGDTSADSAAAGDSF